MFEIAVDQGGTFTDAVLLDEKLTISAAKVLSNPAEPSEGLMGCISALAQERRLTTQELIADTSVIVIGTTVATNAVLEGKGARCCMLYTDGFRDVLELGSRIGKADIYDLRVAPLQYLIPRFLRFRVRERLQYDGQEVTPLNEEDVRDAILKAKQHNVDVPVVCFLHSYINPDHEEKAAAIIKAEYPNVVLSSHILRRRMEGHRFHTASLAAFVKPVVVGFVKAVETRLRENDFKGTLLFMTCSGGLATPDVCIDNPALVIGSGPAAGPLFAKRLAKLAGFQNISAIDIGGTSVDLSILPKQVITTTTETVISGHRHACESIDICSIGRGGGSIAWIDKFGLLRVGPESAGASPGPSCYAKGGRKPTLTDADLVLGYVPADYFLGGKIRLDIDAAKEAIENSIAKPLGIDIVQAAHAISSLVEEDVAKGVFLSFVKKGFDPQEFALVVAGGAGPVHAAAIAARAGIKRLYIPKYASVFCPCGILLADYKYILSRFYHRNSNEIGSRELEESYLVLENEGVRILRNQGVDEENIRLVLGAEIRYLGQLHDIEVLLPETKVNEAFTSQTMKSLIDGFHQRHEAIYGRSEPIMAVTIETLKLHAIGKRRLFELLGEPLNSEDPSAALKRKRLVYFGKGVGFNETQCYDDTRLQPGNVITGPAIIEAVNTTLVVPQEYKLTVDTYSNYILGR